MLESADIVDELISRLSKDVIKTEDGVWYTDAFRASLDAPDDRVLLRCGRSGNPEEVKVFKIEIREVG